MSKLAAPLPPSCSVSPPAPVTTPEMTELGASVSTLPAPLNRIAPRSPPVIVPALTIDEPLPLAVIVWPKAAPATTPPALLISVTLPPVLRMPTALGP